MFCAALRRNFARFGSDFIDCIAQRVILQLFVCTRFSVPASQTQRPRVHVPCPLQRVGSPGQLTSSTCCTRLLTKSGCRSGSSLVLFSVDLISKMQCSSMSSTSPSRKSVKLSASCNIRHNSQLAATFLRFWPQLSRSVYCPAIVLLYTYKRCSVRK